MKRSLRKVWRSVGGVFARVERLADEEEWLEAVSASFELEELLAQLRWELVEAARVYGGATWDEVGGQLGVSRQAAWERYGGGGAGGARQRTAGGPGPAQDPLW